MTLKSLSRFYFSAIFLCAVAALILIPFRLQEGGNLALIPLIFVQLVFMFGAVVALLSGRIFLNRIGLGELVLILLPFILIPISVINDQEWLSILMDAAKPGLFFLNVIVVSVLFPAYDKQRLEGWMRFIAFVALASVGYSFVFLFGNGVKPSASDISMVLPFVFFLVTGRRGLMLMCAVLLFIGGKLGPAFSAALAVAVYYVIRYRANPLVIASLAVFLALSLYFIADAGQEGGTKIGFVAKTQYLAEADYGDLDELDRRFLGGRLSEITYASEPLGDSYLNWIFGMGPGYTYEYFKGEDIAQADRHGVHFTPISIILFYGLIYLVIFSQYIYRLVFQSFYRNISNPFTDPYVVVALVFSIAFLVNAMTSYGIFTSTLFALALGILRANHLRQAISASRRAGSDRGART